MVFPIGHHTTAVSWTRSAQHGIRSEHVANTVRCVHGPHLETCTKSVQVQRTPWVSLAGARGSASVRHLGCVLVKSSFPFPHAALSVSRREPLERRPSAGVTRQPGPHLAFSGSASWVWGQSRRSCRGASGAGGPCHSEAGGSLGLPKGTAVLPLTGV